MGGVQKALEMLRRDYSYRNIFNIMCGYGGKPAAEYLTNGQIKSITYEQYEGIVKAAAKKLSEILKNEDEDTFIGIKLENSPLWPAVFWAVMMSGHRPLLVDFRSDSQATAHVLKQSGARTVITEADVALPGFEVIRPEQFASLDEFEKDYEGKWANAAALCTSGTTATSKVYVYDGHAMSSQMHLAGEVVKTNPDILNDKDVFKNLAFLPLHHIFGFIAVYMWYSFLGKTIVYIKDRAPETILNACRVHRVTNIYAVPLFWNNVATGIVRKARLKGQEEKLLNGIDKSLVLQRRLGKLGRVIASRLFFKDLQANLVGGDIRFMICGGGHVLPETLRILNGIGYHLVVGFGMTETGINSVDLSDNIDLILKASVGKPFVPTEYRIKVENGIGELQIRGDALHSGRMIDGAFVAREKADGGWFSSGDIASEKEGNYFIEGRLKEVIVGESGENVYPDELEDSFAALPGAENICVAGISSGGVYEDIALIVDMGENLGNAAIEKKLIDEICLANSLLPIYKKLGRALVSKNALPVANGIKVQRQKLKKLIEDNEWDYIEIDLKNRKMKDMTNTASEQTTKAQAAQYDTKEFNDIKETVRTIFGEVLSLDPETIKDTDHFVDDLGGDSLSSLGVFTKAEEFYGIVIPDTEYFSCANVLDLTKLLYGKLHKVEAVKPAAAPKQDERRIITKFEDSREYEEYARRLKEVEDLGSADPYFVPHDSPLRDTSIVNGKVVINFGSYNYLGMSGHPETMQAAKDAIDKYGTSASGSRLLAGEKPLHRELERAIADWKHTEDSLVLVGGHSTNVTFVGNFCNNRDIILYDALSHNSIVQGCQLSQSDTKAFPHNKFDALEHMLKAAREKYEKILIVVEGVYSMDGDIAPIPEFVRLKNKYGAFLMVDEAHSGCVIGEHGGGVDDYFHLKPEDIDIRMGTLSKGLGTCGGYLAGSRAMIDFLRHSLAGFMFSVGISPPLAAATLKAIEIIQRDNTAVQNLQRNIRDFVSEAHRHGFNTCLAGETAIIPVMVGEDIDAYNLSFKMLENGVFVPPAVYPAVPRHQARLRFCPISEHKREQIVYALDTLDRLYSEAGIKK
jgi:8-amino-7-oxononanoate synthase/acyl carrier protein